VLVAESGEEVAEILLDLTPARARKIAETARARILAHHTYAHRARQFDSLLNNLTARGEAAE
jgi:spore maturation protein CgeB